MVTYEEVVAKNKKLRDKKKLVLPRPLLYGLVGAFLGSLASLSFVVPPKTRQEISTPLSSQSQTFESYNRKVGYYLFARVGETTREYFESFPETADINKNYISDKLIINPAGEVYAVDKLKSTLIGFVDSEIVFPSENVRARFSKNGQLEALLVKVNDSAYVEYRSRLGSA